MKLSIVIPCYNEEKNVSLMADKINELFKDIKYQIIFVNDGSTDNTEKELKNIYLSDKEHIKIINFSRNFGKDAAIYAGLIHSKSEYITIIDSDLQQNPKYIKTMLNFLEDNKDYDQVAMVNKTRKNDNFINKIFKRSFYKIINKLSDISFTEDASDFRMIRKNVSDAIISLKEVNRFSKGIFSWVGFKTKYMPYEVEKRKHGKSYFSLSKSFSYAFNGIINFSAKPLRIATIIGFFTSMFSFIYLLIIFFKTIIYHADVPGYPSLICVVLLLGGFNLMAIGIVGEYISKIHIEIKNRPIYIAKDKIGFDDNIL